MNAVVYPHIAFTRDGRPYVAGAGIKVELIVNVYTVGGASVDMIAHDFPPLTLGEIHSALAYYFDHKDEMDWEFAEGERMAEEIRARHDSAPELRKRLSERGFVQ